MKKKNNSGFTLIELIIVIALLSIMMGAIMQLFDPIRNIYHDTLDTVNTKTAGETMISFVEDKTRYSTNMLVLKNYVGVPQITRNESKGTAKIGGCSVDFSNVIIIDNNHLRGYALKDYKGDKATIATRKNCTGTMYTMKNIGSAEVLNLNSLDTGTIGEDIYGAYTYTIDSYIKYADSHNMLKFDVKTYEMVYDTETQTYVKDTETEFKASRYFDLVNINLGNSAYSISDFRDFDTDADYDKYPQVKSSDIPADLTEQQKALFDTTDVNNKLTYIFYKINTSNEAQNCEVKFVYSDDDDDPAYAGQQLGLPISVKAGGTITSSKIPTPSARIGYLGYQYVVNGTAYTTKEALTQVVINDDTKVIIEFQKDGSAVFHTAHWCSDKSKTTEYSTSSVFQGQKAAPPIVDSFDYDTKYYEWYEVTTDTLASDFSCYNVNEENKDEATDYYFYPVENPKYKIEFLAHDTPFVDPIYIKPGETVSRPTGTPNSDVEGYAFKDWYVGDVAFDSYTITGNTQFIAKFGPETCSVSITDPVIENYNGGDVKYKITITNGTSSTVNEWELKVKIPSGATYDSGLNWDVNQKTLGNYLVITNTVGTLWDGSKDYHPTIPAKSTLEINIKFKNPNATRTYDYSKSDPLTEYIPADCYITDIQFEKKA